MSPYSLWGWGPDSREPKTADLDAMAQLVSERLGFGVQPAETSADVKALRPSRVQLPEALRSLASTTDLDRARHGIGRSYSDLIRGLRGDVVDVPDVVLRPRSEQDVTACLEWAAGGGVPLIAFGGGTSVVGGVEPRGLDRSASLDLSELSGVLEVDDVSRAARVHAGTLGPELEAQLAPHGLTARFYPQSFERSTVGGWVATRAAGHFSTGPVHIDDLVESVRAVTGNGVWESRRLPGSGAGPSPDRWLLGSEGTLGVITETWLRVQPRPTERWSALYAGADFLQVADAVRAVVQTGMTPATCRVLDGREAALTGTLSTGEAALVVGLESLGPPIDAAPLESLLADHGLRCVSSGAKSADAWRSTFVEAPYLRESLICLGVIAETFETACTWSMLLTLHGAVVAAVEDALRSVCGGGVVTCRTTHAYRDGIAPYFTVLAPARRGSELAQWAQIKAAASEAILAASGTITHHHAVGRDHRPWYDRQRPEPFAAALRAVKAELDPAGVLNPGALIG
ncbi:MAG: alkyldihydroxyacetonephosphate synthase [Frankiaceae bacterium]|nr:alkyldihydroxyacetonephosphate synthase [Frankiaceae bacterium]